MNNTELPDEIYVRAVTDKTLSAVRPDSPIAQAEWTGRLKRTKYVRADKSAPPIQPIDVEKVKREVYAQEFVRHCECDSDLISCAIDHLAAHYNITEKGE